MKPPASSNNTGTRQHNVGVTPPWEKLDATCDPTLVLGDRKESSLQAPWTKYDPIVEPSRSQSALSEAPA